MLQSDHHLPSAGRLRYRLEAAARCLLPGVAAIALYVGVSLLALWDHTPPAIHALAFVAVAALVATVLVKTVHVLVTHTPRQTLHWGWSLMVPPVLMVGIFAAGGDWERRLVVAVRPGLLFPAPDMVITATVVPPAYTREAAITLDGNETAAPFTVPAGSMLHVSVSDTRWPPHLTWGGESVLFREDGQGGYQISGEMRADGGVAVTFAGRALAHWQFKVLPDRVPQVSFAAPLAPSPRGTMRVVADATDDHGIEYLALKITALNSGENYLVPLPAYGTAEISGTYYADLRDQPLAGQKVSAELVAVDGFSQEGLSEPVTATLPAFPFANGLAQALAEIRLVLLKGTPDDMVRGVRRLAALSESSAYATDSTVQLGVRMAYQRLRADDSADTRQDMGNLLWDLALRAEDGNLSTSENTLHEALAQMIAALRQKQPVEMLESHLQTFMRRLEDYGRARSTRVLGSGQVSPSRQTLREPVDWTALQRFLTRLRGLIVGGHHEEALRQLTELEQGMEERPNLLLSAPAYRRFLAASYARRLLTDVAREQRRLLSRAVASDIAGLPESGAALPPVLRRDQVALREIIVGIISQLDRAGLEDIDSVRRAKESMDDAVKSLAAGQGDGAASAQVQVLTALDLAAKALSLVPSPLSQDAQGQYYDPLGRPLPPTTITPGIDIEESLRRGGI